MTETNMRNLDTSDLTNAMTDYSVDAQTTDGVADQDETYWDNTRFTEYLGYYKSIPELASAIDAKATWTIGKGFKADERTTLLLMTINGWGKDTFNTILENCVRTYQIGGDSFCEIIREDNVLVNLKPLDPSVMRIVVDKKGRVKRYEQISKVKGKLNKRFEPDEIFHLARNRVADEIHGVSVIPAVENIILMRNEAMTDWRRVLHRNIDPVRIYNLDTDDPTTIAAFKAKADAARGNGENLYIPKGAVEVTNDVIAPNSSLNPMAWIENLNKYFYAACGVPQIIVGGSGEFTEASAKIAYLAFEQTIEEEQLFIEEQTLAQLNLAIELEFPASLENEMLAAKPTAENRGIEQEQALQPKDTNVGAGRG